MTVLARSGFGPKPGVVAALAGALLICGTLGAQVTTTTTLSVSPSNMAQFGQPVTLTATITPSSAAGTVSFMNGGVLVGVATVNGSGIAQTTTIFLPAGHNSLRAVYSGESGVYDPSQSAKSAYVVNAISGAGFATAQNYATGTVPTSVALGDFNGDGIADLVVANSGANNVSVLLGNGNGTYQDAVNYAAGTGPSSVAVGDLNGDGFADLVVANYGANNVSVLLGNGNGTFQTAVNYGAGFNPFSVVVGDFNGDGKADLAVANSGSGNVSVLLGKGDGTFLSPVNYNVGTTPSSAAVGDFNGDGIPDLAVANLISNNVSVLLGNGDGTFQTAVNYTVGASPGSVAIGDFNGDGVLDLAVANYGSSGSGTTVSVLMGNSSDPGTFLAAVNYTVGTGPSSVAVGDFNGDGKIDLAVANFTSNNVSILLGNGNGTFQAAVNWGAGTGPESVVVGNLNGDGRADLAVANNGGNNVSVLLGTALPPTTTILSSSPNPSRFGQAVTLTAVLSPSNAPGSVEFLDGTTVLGVNALNGSGIAELVTTALGAGPSQSLRAVYPGVPGVWQSSESVVVNQVVNAVADSGLATAVNYGVGTGAEPDSVAVGDFNGDGIADLAVANSGTNNVSVLLGNGNGTFQSAVNYGAGSEPNSVAVGDFNGDGKLDLAVANYGANTVSVLLGNGNGTFQTAVSYGVGTNPYSVAVGDFNGDGIADLAVANYGTNNVSVLLGNGNGTFQTAMNTGVGTNPESVAVGDFNGDGIADLAVANYGTNNVSVLLGKGNGTFQAAVNYGAGTGPESVAVGDFNGDGIADFAVANNGANNVSVLLGNGDGTFQTAVSYAAGTNPTSVAVGDFNGDGNLALIVANNGSNNVSVLLGNGNGTFQTAVNYGAGTNPRSVAVGNFNGDGRADVAVANFGSNNVSILLGLATPLQFFSVAPCRMVDTRAGQGKSGSFGPPSLAAYSSRSFPLLSAGCSIPSTAQAYSLNLTAVPTGPVSFLSAWPTGESYPGVSTLNSTDGSTIANAAIVPAGTSGSITVVAGNPTDLIVDINGYFAPVSASGLDFLPLTPCRIVDTRVGQGKAGAFGPPSLTAYDTRDFPIATSPCLSSTPQAYSLNMTAVPSGPLSFLSAWPVGLAYPGVSTLNSPDGTALANAALVPAGTGGDIDVVAGNNTDLIIDINGTFQTPGTGSLKFYPVTPCRVADTRSSQGFTGAFGPPSLAAYSSRNFPVQSSTCGIPASAQAYALNMTVVPQGPLSFLSSWPAGQVYPGVSTLNSTNGNIIANAAIVPAGTGGAITVVAGNPTDLIIDIVGYFAP